jgi:4-hydroxy-4-methyl-2-oxoglutarate aldolase
MTTLVRRPDNPRLSDSLIASWRRVPAAVAADQLGVRAHADPAIRPLGPLGHGVRLIGSAITAWCDPAFDYGAVHHAIAVAEAGDVIVIAAAGRDDAAMIGELLSTAARHKGIAGVIADGAVRDSATIAEWPDFIVFARSITPRGPTSMSGGVVNRTVDFAGATISPHDLVIGDNDGVVIVPHGLAEARLAACLARVDAEDGWQEALAGGRSTVEVFNVPAARAE